MEIKDVENLAELSRLDLSQAEKEKILHDMGGILEYVKSIEAVSVGDVIPDYPLTNVWREDEVTERDFSRESIMEQFPNKQDDFLKVKKIL